MADEAAALRSKILAANDQPLEQVELPEWGITAFVRTMRAGERDAWEQEMIGKGEGERRENLRASLVARCLVDSSGQRVFADADVVALSAKAAGPVDRAFAVATRLNGLSQNDVEELEKNLPDAPD